MKQQTLSPIDAGGDLRASRARSVGSLAACVDANVAFPSADAVELLFGEESGIWNGHGNRNWNSRLHMHLDDHPADDSMARSPILADHEHGLGSSGLRRMRQQHQPSLSRSSTLPFISTDAWASLSLPASRRASVSPLHGAITPIDHHVAEDLSRFPSESLHSFSFAQQSEDSLHNRQAILKRSIDFMKDKLGWAASNAGIVSATARLSGDQDIMGMMDLLTRANLIGRDAGQAHGLGVDAPLTGPAHLAGDNVFEKSFLQKRQHQQHQSPLLDSISTFSSQKDGASDSPLSNSVSLGVSPTSTDLPPRPMLAALKRTYTDLSLLAVQTKLKDALAQPYNADSQPHPQTPTSPALLTTAPPNGLLSSGAHGRGSRWTPANQAVFTTQASLPWTILAANDLACLLFGVTKSEVRKISILEVVAVEWRDWLQGKLTRTDESGSDSSSPKDSTPQDGSPQDGSPRDSPTATSTLAIGNGVTAKLLSKPPSRLRQHGRRSKRLNGGAQQATNGESDRGTRPSRDVLLCGDVITIQKRNGAIGSASLWVKRKQSGLIWVLEEIAEDIAFLTVDEVGCITKSKGSTDAIWGSGKIRRGMDIARVIPGMPRLKGTNTGALDYGSIKKARRYTAKMASGISIPITVDALSEEPTFRVSSFPHIAGMIILSASDLTITSANLAFSAALFGHSNVNGKHITDIIPAFAKVLHDLEEEDGVQLQNGTVIPEQNFRRAMARLSFRTGNGDTSFLRAGGISARHRDGTEMMVDLQMRVMSNEKGSHDAAPAASAVATAADDSQTTTSGYGTPLSESPGTPETIYALWVNYSRQIHATTEGKGPIAPLVSRPATPPHQPSPGQTLLHQQPEDLVRSSEPKLDASNPSILAQQLKQASTERLLGHRSLTDKQTAKTAATSASNNDDAAAALLTRTAPTTTTTKHKKTIDDFHIIDDMGRGAYGEVKLCRYKSDSSKIVVLKYVVKRRILVDTWIKDRKLGTVPLEIQVLDLLRHDPYRHPHIVDMADFFEDDVNYYIEMVPHGLPGMDLFDFIELRVNMDEAECRKIFVQVAQAIHHLHVNTKIVHRDLKDENIVLDGEGNIKLIDFGSAAYIKNGPFQVFVGTIDYAAPEVLGGKPYKGKEQDVWALGILLYTIIYKENPFYSIDEIMDHHLRVPFVLSDDSIDLIRLMLERDVNRRVTIEDVVQHPWCLAYVV